MSTGVTVKRPTAGSLPTFRQPRDALPASTSQSPAGTPSSPLRQLKLASPMVEKQKMVQLEAEFQARVRQALQERDEQWRRHEKAQITFLQNEGEKMLKGLHLEIDRLGHQLRDAKRQLFVSGADSPICDHGDLQATAMQQEERIRELEEVIRRKEAYSKNIEVKVRVALDKMQEQINLQADRIRQLTGELNDRNQTVAHLSSQLRTFRLREAIASAQQRRRASQSATGTTPPLTSPTSPHRIFPPGGKGQLVNSSVHVTYPGSRSQLRKSLDMAASSSMGDLDGPGSIEKPKRRRSSSQDPISKSTI